MTDTRHREPRPGAGLPAPNDAEIAAMTDERPVRPSKRPIFWAAFDSCHAAGRGGGVVVVASREAALGPMVVRLGASFGGWIAGADAQGGSRRIGEEVR